MQRLYRYLPPDVLSVISNVPHEVSREICELRLRMGSVMSLSTYTKNLFVTPSGRITSLIREGYICSDTDIISTVSRLTEGSVYRYMNTINSGYIVTKEGIRAGITGEAVYTDGRISSVADFTSLNIRLPHDVDDAGDAILGHIKSSPSSILIYSPSGYGKTTVIRAVAKGIALGKYAPPQRVAVIDERGEILPGGNCGLTDRLLGYSKPCGIEIAVRLFNPEYVICDEIGLSDDTRAILSVQNTGVPFIATTHGKSIDDLMHRPCVRELIDNNVFGAFARLERQNGRCITVFEELNI